MIEQGSLNDVKQVFEMKTTFTVERSGREVTVTLHGRLGEQSRSGTSIILTGWDLPARGCPMLPSTTLGLTHEEWPQGFSDGELTPEEFKRARAEAMEKAEEAPYDCIAA